MKILNSLNLFEKFRAILLDTIDCLPESPHKNMKFIHYQNLVYSAVFGKTAKEIKKENKINKRKSVAGAIGDIDRLKCCGVMATISAKLKEGKDYKQIKRELIK